MDFEIVLVVVIGVVILGSLALWLGRGMKIRKDKEGFTLETEADQKKEAGGNEISLGKGLEIEESAAGDIAAIKGRSSESADMTNKIDVLEGGKIRKSEVGDIVGIKKDDKSGEEHK